MRNVRRYGNHTAMIDPLKKKAWNYKELNCEVNKLVNRLYKDGLQKGDVLMMMLFNCPEFVFTYVAAHKGHFVFAPVSFRLSAGELADLLVRNHPKVLFFDSFCLPTVLEAVKMSDWTPQRLIMTDGSSDGSILSYKDYIDDSSDDEPAFTVPYNIYDETSRLFTSGTTGHAKAVPLTSVNEVLSAHDVMIHFPFNNRDISMNTTPWFHRGGLHCAGPCPTLYAGATLVVMKKFDAMLTLKYVERYKITFVIGVPTVLERLADEQEKGDYDLSTLHGIVTMGSPLERSACIRYQQVLTPNIYNGYGTTETFWNTFLHPFDLPQNSGTAGVSCVDDDVRVVKVYEDRKAEPDDLAEQDGTEIGEVIISSPAKCPFAYSNNGKENEEKYYKGFFYTNDLATWDENQFVSIVGRKDDMIISSGENIYPVEVEEVLNGNPKVKECIVTSVPDKMRGQLVTAYVVKADDSLTAEELDEFCKKSPAIANFKRPRYYRFVASIPLNATGKKMHVKVKAIAAEDLRNGLLERV